MDGMECAEECMNLLNEMKASATGPCANWLTKFLSISGFRERLRVRTSNYRQWSIFLNQLFRLVLDSGAPVNPWKRHSQ